MDAGLVGLQQALGQAGIALTENGPQVVASDAMAPPNSAPVEADPFATPPAAPQPETTTDSGDEHYSLDEYAAVLSGEDAPETGVETAATTEAAPQQAFTERELEMQRKLDEYEAKEAEYDIWDKIGAWEDAYAAKEAEGRQHWEVKVPAQIQAAAKQQAVQQGWSDAETEARIGYALANVKEQQRQWDLKLLTEKLTNPNLRPETYKQPALVDQLVTQYGLSADDKVVLQKYATNPDLMKDVAQTIGSRIQMHTNQINTTVKAAQTQARQERAAELQNGITPTAPAVSPHKAPPDWSKVSNEEGAAFWAKQLQSGSLRSRP